MNILNPFDCHIDAVRQVYSYLTRIFFFGEIYMQSLIILPQFVQISHINKVLTYILPPRHQFIFNKPVWNGFGKVYCYTYSMRSQSLWIGACCHV